MPDHEFIDISIPFNFGGPQPRAFGAEGAVAIALGDTREGSSVNFERYSFAPHCSGTHTECVGHITHERISVLACLTDVLIEAAVVSVKADSDSVESYGAKAPGDRSITAAELRRAVEALGVEASADLDDAALIVRTLPNSIEKLTAVYDERNIPPYFTDEAIAYIVELGVKHLLVDLPSIDRISDGGVLSNHRRFWNVAPGSFEAREHARRNATITELIYVPNEIPDGAYQLNLQIAPFNADAAPSRPMLRTV
ncbi:MAG TPA: cyclase family protein [Pyrinomonadaceae bacterium]|nr:cyclase family protein [Pyrinomonadaceae bacterium]